ncbi:MAG: hypothetical protein ACKVI6_04180 [Candidatus Poseidoniales archaeon]|jgi:hypothetical protein|tara:strand:+ start:44 stop:592 length:549 start_codon:yes stop_codon:yes gene_type:complete
MSDTELMKKLLDGTLDPVELENNPHLYTLAERIYGREALEEMGVSGPSIDLYGLVENNGLDIGDVEIPDFIPDMSKISKNLINKDKTKRRKFILLIGIIGFGTILSNILIGIGQILCSLGLANMVEICVEKNTQVMWINARNWEGLHEISTWKATGHIEIFDMMLLAIFSIMIIIGLFVKKD